MKPGSILVYFFCSNILEGESGTEVEGSLKVIIELDCGLIVRFGNIKEPEVQNIQVGCLRCASHPEWQLQ